MGSASCANLQQASEADKSDAPGAGAEVTRATSLGVAPSSDDALAADLASGNKSPEEARALLMSQALALQGADERSSTAFEAALSELQALLDGDPLVDSLLASPR
jgi:hypothetical protein